MKLQSHIIAGLAGTAIFYPMLGPEKSLLFFTASVLIDADHYLDYLIVSRGKDWNPKRMFRYYDCVTENNPAKNHLGFSLLHTAEIFLVVYLLSKYLNFDLFMPILLGMAYHMIFDIAWLTYHKIPTVRAYSIVEYFIRKKIMIKEKLNPEKFDQEMFELSDQKENTENDILPEWNKTSLKN